jgi:aminopeptidase N
MERSLDYYQSAFGPYQFDQARIIEFPGYATFAQAFANTMPYSEAIGFLADNSDPDAIDYVFYVTAHEVGHQWWAHQVIGGNVQGGTMLVETMAQYSALMVMEKEYGRDKMQKFLRYELDRYLRDRGGELVAEMPLSQVENQQYIHYRKGSVVMYALRDLIGEDKVNAALAKFLKASMKGWEYAVANQDEAVKIVLENDETGAQTEGHQKTMMQEIAKLVGQNPKGTGYLDEAAYERTVKTLMSGGSDPVITKAPEGAWTHDVIGAAK